jgi:hypothetical protein
MRFLVLSFAVVFLAGCPDSRSPTDSGSDGFVDSSADAGLVTDVASDVGAPDATQNDAGLLDATSDAAIDGAMPDDVAADHPDAGADAASDASAACGADAVTMRLPGLLFTSESDFPLDYASFPDEGASAPTMGDVARLSAASASATIETRDEAWFWTHVVVDPTRMPPAPDAQIGELQSAFEAIASDRIVVRVIEPSDPARVHVYLAGRTTCGSLVWLASIAIET